MVGNRYSPEVIIRMLREAEVLEWQGKAMAQAVRQSRIAEQTFPRWRKEYGGKRRHRPSASSVAIGAPPG